ncbi:DsbA family oxidoreductase [Roseovarius autotrophicus]|uniref:DsbA family oxidoreductase n=1 Tax=Roseovarius autotrophicus TaxID=2824121 RepID=UPI0019E6AB3B|nr:DsbA family oxidoreductase [Roseovarius autotrophicus]MBE0454041.1 DsbA family oxidoreductase [Roseovarius sp.]
MVRLDIISDPICPWCYIGKTLLDQALAERPGHPFEIHWQPFQLNPEMPEGGMDRKAYLEGKFGGREGAIRAYAPVLERAEAAGLNIDFAAIPRTPNTLDAHRLLHWAEVEECQDRMAMALFHAYFEEGRDIGDHEVLADIADSLSLDAALIRRLLASDADRAEISERDARFRNMGITGVPTFIVNGQHALPGCQPPETWLRVIDEITAQLAE